MNEEELEVVLSWKPAIDLIRREDEVVERKSEAILQQRAWVEIDCHALKNNVEEIKKLLSPNTELMAVVKADAYGHGAVKVARTALQAGANALAIATLGEGIELRQSGISAPILILGAINTVDEVEAIASWQLEPTLFSPEQAILFSETIRSLDCVLPVHLKLDTGMSRLGINWELATEFVQLILSLPNLSLKSIYSHLATADEIDSSILSLQHRRFEGAIASLRSQGIKLPKLHLANSAATLRDRNLHYDLVRVGLALYGLYPAPHLTGAIELQPVLQVKARVAQVKKIAAGDGVSYGYTFIADRDLLVATIGIGYADGIPRHLSNRLEVLIRGEKVQQIGTITMDQLMLDVSQFPDLQIGEIVTLIGQEGKESISADDWANTLGTISWEILCGFKHRLPRIAIGDD
jgi:alanine racemase